MPPNLSELNPESPEFAAAEEAMLRAEDEEAGKSKDESGPGTPAPEPSATPAAAPAADVAAAAGTPPASPAPAPAAKPVGVLGKDGKTVLPYAALAGARRESQAERQGRIAAEARVSDLQRQLDELKAGKAPAAEESSVVDDELATDYPAQAAAIRALEKKVDDKLRTAREELAAAAPTPAPVAPPADADSNPTQEAIDSVPILAEWQGSKGAEWQAAVALDKALIDTPKWKSKPEAERFKFVAKTIADQFDLAAGAEQFGEETPSPTPQPSPPRKDPDEVIKGAKRIEPQTLSDFKGGAPDASRDTLNDRTPAIRQVNSFSRMSDEEIDAHLAKLG